MPYVNPDRNTQGILWQELRARADAAYHEMHDEFCQKHYDYWRLGQSSPWGPFDVKPTLEETILQFLDLQVMTQDMHVVMRHKINHKMNQLGEPGVIPQPEYRYTYNNDGSVNEDLVMKAKDRMAETSASLGVSAKTMMDHYRQRIADMNGPDYSFPDWSIPDA